MLQTDNQIQLTEHKNLNKELETRYTLNEYKSVTNQIDHQRDDLYLSHYESNRLNNEILDPDEERSQRL